MHDSAAWEIAEEKAHQSLDMWQAAGIMPTRFTRLRVLDIACGCGMRSMALAQKSTGILVTCVQQPHTLQAARDLAQRLNVAPQVTLCAGDMATAELGVALYDVCLLGQINRYLAEPQSRDLYRRIKSALLPGGLLILDVAGPARKPEESADAQRPFDTYSAWLKDAGFRDVKLASKLWLVANR